MSVPLRIRLPAPPLTSPLRAVSDQDHDGSHIKGLIINFIHRECLVLSKTPIPVLPHYRTVSSADFWPSLLTIPGFLQQFITPIVKVSKGPSSLAFYTTPEYTAWKDAATAAAAGGKLTGWQIKYYKVNRISTWRLKLP